MFVSADTPARAARSLTLALCAGLALLLAACGEGSPRAANGARRPAARLASGRASLNATLGDPASDASAACGRGDFRFWTLEDEHGAPSAPSNTGASGRLTAMNLGYHYEVRPLMTNQAAATPEEFKRAYEYALAYNDAVFAYMRAHARQNALDPRDGRPVQAPPAPDEIVRPRMAPAPGSLPVPADADLPGEDWAPRSDFPTINPIATDAN